MILKKLGIFGFLALFCAANAFAGGEPIHKIALNKAQKAQLVSALQARISSHEQMTREEILVDLENLMHRESRSLESSGKISEEGLRNFNSESERFLNIMNQAPDKDSIIAVEQAQLQAQLSSDNLMFMLTSMTVGDIHSARFNDEGVFLTFDIMLLPFAVALDLALLPVTFIASAVTGF